MNIGLHEEKRRIVAHQLALLLANEYILYTKTLKFHWNVRGAHFGALHAFFQNQYEMLLGIVDDVAERIRALGFIAPGSLREFLEIGTLVESITVDPSDSEMLELLLRDHEAVIRQIRHDVDISAAQGDMGSNNFLADLLEKHEKMAWMLRAHVENDAAE